MELLKRIFTHSPIVGAFVCESGNPNLLFINEGFLKLLEYEDFKNLSLTKLVEKRDDINWILREHSVDSYRNITYITSDGERKKLPSFFYPIEIDGKKANLIIVVDEVGDLLHRTLYKALSDINNAIIRSETEEELFETITRALAKDVGFDLVAVGEVDKRAKEFKTLHAYGKKEIVEEIRNLKIPLEYIKTDKNLTLIENLEEHNIPQTVKEFLKKHGIKSLCVLPVTINGTNRNIFMLCSSRGELFSELYTQLLLEMQEDVAFAIKKIEENKERKFFMEAFENSPAWIVATDKNGNIIKANETVFKTTGYTEEELIGKNPRIFKSGEHPPEFYKRMWETIKAGKVFRETIINKKKNGELFYLDSIIMPVMVKGKVYRYINISRDITKEVLQRKHIEKLSRLYRTLSAIEELLLKQYPESELLSRLPSVVLENSDFDVCFVIKRNENSRGYYMHSFSSKDSSSKEIIYFIQNRIEDAPESLSRCAFTKAIETGSIKMKEIGAESAEELGCPPDIKIKFEENGFHFILAIPLLRGNEAIAALSMISRQCGFADSEYLQLFEKIKEILSNQLQKLEMERNYRILIRAVNMSEDGILILDKKFSVIYANAGILKITEYSMDELVGKPYEYFLARTHSKEFISNLFLTLGENKTFSGVMTCRTKTGKLRKLITTITPYRENEEMEYYIVTCADITQQQELQESLEKILSHDSLTGMINRRTFIKKISFSINRLSHKGMKGAMCVINPLKLKHVNQAFGFEIGDRLLIEIGNRIQRLIRPYDIPAKLESDRFAVFFDELKTEEDALIAILRLIEGLSKTYMISGREINMFFEAGVSLYPHDAQSAEELLQKAEIALADAKGKGKTAIGFYREQLKKEAERKITLKTEVTEALHKKQFILFFQPYFDIRNGRIVGAEALIRWKKGNHIIPPMEFIPYLEEINMISDIEEWITRVVPEKLHTWQSEGIDVVPISINISPDSFKNRDFIESIAININGVDPSLISLEIVERLFLDNPTYTREILNTLKSRGFRVYMDDFGTGYSSLSYLSNLPIDCIKIDISFIKKMVKDSNTRAIVKAIILLAKELKIKTIAEGVETEEQLNLLKEFGCDYIQGFLFSKPLPEEEFVKLLKQ